jgi:hypothetical protein
MRGTGGVKRSASGSGLVTRALQMLQSIGWIAAHRLLFTNLRLPPARLARVSRSGRAHRGAPPPQCRPPEEQYIAFA